MKIRVGFILNSNKNSWRGGYEYIKNLFKSISLDKSSKIKIIIISDRNKSSFSDLGKFEFISSDLFKNNFFNRIINKLLLVLVGRNLFLENYLKKNNIDCISHFYLMGKKSQIANIYWIPDFQEIKKIDYLTKKMKILRNLNTVLAIKQSKKILLSSYSVKKDLKKINFDGFKKSVVLRPPFIVPDYKNLYKLNYLKKKYKFNTNYFFLPNQFWIHKNHILVLEILKELKKEKKEILVISTGVLHDYRYPEHREFLLNFIKKNNLKKNFMILEIVPYKILMSLMFNAIAVINPSKSEGWSSTVEQAKAYGKQILLSNIDVHLEQKPKRSFYFDPDDRIKLKKKILSLSKKYDLAKEKSIIKKNVKIQIKKQTNFSKEYSKIIFNLLNDR